MTKADYVYVLEAERRISRNCIEVLYYCDSTTQGARMVPYALSMARQFDTPFQARQHIDKLSIKYRGLGQWKALRVSKALVN